jgi:hypothetical protein
VISLEVEWIVDLFKTKGLAPWLRTYVIYNWKGHMFVQSKCSRVEMVHLFQNLDVLRERSAHEQ